MIMSPLDLERVLVHEYNPPVETTLPFGLIRQILHLAECQLATVEEFEMLKRPPKARLNRQRTIANQHLQMIRQYGIDKIILRDSKTYSAARHCPRVIERLQEHPLKQLARQAV